MTGVKSRVRNLRNASKPSAAAWSAINGSGINPMGLIKTTQRYSGQQEDNSSTARILASDLQRERKEGSHTLSAFPDSTSRSLGCTCMTLSETWSGLS